MGDLVKKVLDIYKIPLLVSITVFIIIMAMLVPRDPWDIFSIALAALIGTFVLDLDYIFYTYLTDPMEDFSHTLRGYIKHNDYTNALTYIYYHRDDVKEKTLQSVLFQVILAAFTFFMVFSPLGLLARTLVISTYANSLYRLGIRISEDRYEEWFWMLKNTPSKKKAKIYLGVSVLAFLILTQFL